MKSYIQRLKKQARAIGGKGYPYAVVDLREFEAFLTVEIERARGEEREFVKIELIQMDWIKILDGAIKTRPTSWGSDVVREWRNASDTVMGSVIYEAEEKGIFKNLKQKLSQLRKVK